MSRRESLQTKLAAHGQADVLRFYQELDQDGRQRLLDQLEDLDLDYLARATSLMSDEDQPREPSRVEPYTDVIRRNDPELPQALALGREMLGAGRVGVLLVAGGSGTRLGFDGPKGIFPLGPVSGSTLFQLHLERLVAAGARYGVVPPLYLMTSPENHEATCRFLEQNHRFGLPADRVVIFPQGQAPAVDMAGKLLLAAKDQLVLSPNGNGGLFRAMQDGGAFAHMRQSGVDTINYIQVDNALAHGVDPLFCGVHALRDADFSCKAMPKVGALEKVGNFASVNGRLGIVEYYEIPDDLAQAKDAQGELLFNFGSPGLFCWSRQFAEAQAARPDLPIHLAHKKIAHLDTRGQRVDPVTPNGYKLEMFALDTLAAAERPLVLAIERDDEFAPVKNADGVDSPETARALMGGLHRRWLEQAGLSLGASAMVELGPRFALDAEEVVEKADQLRRELHHMGGRQTLYLSR